MLTLLPVMIGFLTPLADDGIGYSFGYVFFGTNLAAALLVWFFLYESRTLSLENVDLMYSEKDLKPWTSSKWVPPGYITRMQRDASHFRNMSVSAADGMRDGASDDKGEKRVADNDDAFNSHQERV